MSRLRQAALASTFALAAAHSVPAVTSRASVRRHFQSCWTGQGRRDGVALTFDDGPDPHSTPQFLTTLADLGVQATFFLLGSMVDRAPGLAAEITAAGHEVAVHGHSHRNLLLAGPAATREQLARGRDAVAAATGRAPEWFRPPYGVLNGAACIHAPRLGLRPVLWTAWGEDWTAHATSAQVAATVLRDLRPGGTVLLHDSDCTSAPGSWRAALGALPRIVEHCRASGLAVRPLGQHLDPA